MTRALLAAALLLGGCAGGRQACTPRAVALVNASARAVEQVYLGTGRPGGWGADVLAPNEVARGATATLRPPPGPFALRVVWADGRAAELAGLDGCATQRIVVAEGSVRGE